MIDRFEELLRDLGAEYSVSLHPDKRGICKLSINEVMNVQIEYNPDQNTLLMATFICDLPPGKFRENVLKAALKTNHLYPEKAVLSYSEKNNQLALFHTIPITSLTGKKLSDLLEQFIKKADEWRVAVDTGNIASLVAPVRLEGKGMFGLMP